MAGKVLDFTDVKDGGQFQPRHVPEGDYTAKITAVVDQKSKSDQEDMWVFTLKLVERPSGSYPFYCKLTAEQLWKVRNLLVAAGISVPKKRMKVDPNRVIGKIVGVAMVDDEYEGRMKSVVDSIYPADDAEEDTGRDDTEDDGDDEEEDDEPPAKPAKKSTKKQPIPEPDDDEEDEDTDDDEDDEEEPPPPPKKSKKAPAKKSKKSKPAPPPEDDEDEDDDLDVDDDDL